MSALTAAVLLWACVVWAWSMRILLYVSSAGALGTGRVGQVVLWEGTRRRCACPPTPPRPRRG